MQTLKVGTLTRTSLCQKVATRGFTFIELLVVLIILGVCATIVFPKMDRLLVWESEPWKSGRRFVRIAKYTHEYAVATESMLFLNIDVPAGKYWVSKQDSKSRPGSSGAYRSLEGQLSGGVCISRIELAGDEVVLDDVLTIRFSPDGWSDSAKMILTSPEDVSATATIGESFGDIELVGASSVR